MNNVTSKGQCHKDYNEVWGARECTAGPSKRQVIQGYTNMPKVMPGQGVLGVCMHTRLSGVVSISGMILSSRKKYFREIKMTVVCWTQVG